MAKCKKGDGAKASTNATKERSERHIHCSVVVVLHTCPVLDSWTSLG